MSELAGKTRRIERQRVTFRVMKFGRYVTVDDGGNHVTFHELNQRLRKYKKITKAQSDSVSNREFKSAVPTAPRFLFNRAARGLARF